MLALSDVKQQLNLKKVANYYGYKVNRAGFIKCPIHNEKTASLKIYENGKGFYCFGCGAGGTVIDFVMKVFGLDFKVAITELNEDFSLGLTETKNLSRFERMKIAMKQDQERKKLIEKQEAENFYNETLDEWIRLDKNRIKYKPKTPYEPYNELFLEAINKLSYQGYLLTIAEMRLKT